MEIAIFGAGCFWGVELNFGQVGWSEKSKLKLTEVGTRAEHRNLVSKNF